MASSGPPRLPSGKTAREIVVYLRDQIPRTVPTHEIVRVVRQRAGVAKSTVRKALSRLSEQDPPPVVQVERGWWRAWVDPSDLAKIERPLPCLHAIQLRLRSPQNRGIPPRGGQQTFSGAGPGPEYAQESKQYQDRWVWRGRKVLVQLSSTTGTVLVSMNGSENPLEPSEFREFSERLAGWCDAHGIWWDERQAEVVNLELNQDYAELSVSEFRKARLRTFKRAWVQVYQKAERLMRMELRVAPEGGISAGELGRFMEALVRLTHDPDGELGKGDLALGSGGSGGEPGVGEGSAEASGEEWDPDAWDPSIV